MEARRGIWFGAILTALALILITSPVLAGKKQPSKGTVAVVNGSVITRADLDMEMSNIQQQYLRNGEQLNDSQIKKEALDNLVDIELLYQESQKKGIKIDEQILRRMTVQQFIDKQFIQKVTVSDKEIKAYYNSHPDYFKQPEKVQASHILIKVATGADKSQKTEARKKIEKILKKLQKGGDFAALAKEFSQCPSSVRGGDLGYFTRGQMAKPFEETAFDLKPGKVSDIVETKFGYHLIKVTDKEPETTAVYESVKDSLGQYLKQEKIQEKISSYIDKLKKKAKVETFLTESSQ